MMEKIRLTSGAVVDAYDGHVSLGPAPDLMLGHGHDGMILLHSDEWAPEGQGLTDAQCVELADLMLDRWRQFRERNVCA